MVALARRDGGMRGAVRDGALQRVELAQRGDQFWRCAGDLGQRHRGLPQHEGRHEKIGHAAMRGAQPESKPPSRHSCVISNGLIVEIRAVLGRKQ